MNLPVMLDLAHREIPDVQSVVVRQGESGALTLKIAIVENKKPVDLTGYEAYLKAARPDGAVISQPCTIEQPTKGGVSYTLPPEIAGVVGKISLAHVEIRKSDTLIATTDDLSILVRPRVDMDAAEAESVVSEIDHLKDLLHGVINDGSAQLASQSSEFTALKSESQAATATANTAASNANDAATNATAATTASATQTAACAAATTAAMDVATTALSKRRADTLYSNALIGSAQGDMVHVVDAWSADAIGLRVMGKSAQDGTPTPDAPIEIDVVDGPVTVKVADGSQALINQQTITLPSDHNYLASLPDGTHDELVLRADGVAVLVERVMKDTITGGWGRQVTAPFVYYAQSLTLGSPPQYITSYLMCDHFQIGNTKANSVFIANYGLTLYLREPTVGTTQAEINDWFAANPVKIIYKLATPIIRYSADNGATWSTTDPTAGTSAIPLHKGTNNVWCTDSLSPTVDLDYVQDTNKVINELRAAIVASGATS